MSFHRALWTLGLLLGTAGLPALAASPPLLPPASSAAPEITPRRALPFRGLGVNVYDAFARSLESTPARPVAPLFGVLAERRIPFVRFAACGYWPVHWGLYLTNRAEHFRRLDAVFAAAEEAGLGLVPSLFWHPPTLSDLSQESFDQWGNPDSRTRAFMQTYTREMVTRYRTSPALRAWEFGNEFNLPADLPNAAEHRPPTHPALGTPATRSARDDLTHDAFRSALAHFARDVRALDPQHPVLSGNAFPRPSAWHQRHERSWAVDSEAQWTSMLEADHPDPMGTLTGRLYTDDDLQRLPWAAAAARRSQRLLFIGEFGVPGRLDDAALHRFQAQLDALERHRVDVAALWVVDFDGQAADWNVTPTNDRARLLDLVVEWNRRHVSAP